jgi:hypothetical protein
MPCDYDIKLQKTATDDKVSTLTGQYLKVDVKSVQNLADTGIFVFSREPKVPETGAYICRFESVATPIDLSELPFYSSSEPASSDSSTTKFRTNIGEFYFRSRTEADAAWDYIVKDVDYLLKALELKCKHLAEPVSLVYSNSNPTVTDDNTKGYAVNDVWLNTITGASWKCTSAATGAAVWVSV